MGSKYADGGAEEDGIDTSEEKQKDQRQTIALERCASTHKLTSRRMATAKSRPPDIGILAIEVYFPNYYVEQSDMEKHDNVPDGKYTKGLGQQQIGVVSDLEDINSLCMTAVDMLMTKHGIDWNQIGHLQVGTETLLDKAKSVKTVLLQLWEEHGSDNADIEGVDNINGSYGGTAALFNALNWLESTAWDGRLCLVVAADIAMYKTCDDRPTSGAGAVAMLLGPHAPLIIEPGLRSSFFHHVYDFYKPYSRSQNPIVSGSLVDLWYFKSLDACYEKFCSKCENRGIFSRQTGRHSLHDMDAVVFHSSYCKLAEEAIGRLYYVDYLRSPEEEQKKYYSDLYSMDPIEREDTYTKKAFNELLVRKTKRKFVTKTYSSLYIMNRVGNMYTASVYANLACVMMSKPPEELAGSRVGYLQKDFPLFW
jgi:hydroxymethylglutaryl-CoA synthase